MSYTEESVRKSAYHYITPEVASCAGITLQQLQQFLAGTVTLTPEQIHQLALRMRLYP